MNISYKFPPNIAKITEVFKHKDGTLYCYGNTIYFPGKPRTVTAQLMTHENIHRIQQGDDIEGWWDKYLADPQFRLEQEIPAHVAEWGAWVKRGMNRNQRRLVLGSLSRRLGGRMYGNLIKPSEAKAIILDLHSKV